VGHLFGVASLVLEDGGSEDEAIAALLHDAVEDQGGAPRLADIRARFGERVAAIVAGCTDAETDPKPPWRERKAAYLAHLREAPPDVLRVSSADRLYHARARGRDAARAGTARVPGCDRQLLPSIPKIRRLPENNTRQGFFERPDLEAVVAALPDYLRDFTRFAYLTGWRKGEIISLRWTDVDRNAGVIRLRPEAAKTGRGRMVVLEGDLAELIDRRWEARLFAKGSNPGVAVFVFHRDGRPVGDFGKAWATTCRAAGVPDKLFHDLRRTAARNMVRAGVPERVAMAITGHITRSMFDRYNIVSEDDLRLASQKTTMYVDTLPTKR